jgi:hypothetical protein
MAIASLKSAVRALLESAPAAGLSDAQIGRTLGIYGGHVGHEGHISRTLLSLLESEGVVKQDSSTRYWRLTRHVDADDVE